VRVCAVGRATLAGAQLCRGRGAWVKAMACRRLIAAQIGG